MSDWGCPRCGTDANWATRSACRNCGAAAPRKVLDAIASAAKKPKPGAHPQPWGQWKYGAPSVVSRDKELAALHLEVSALKKHLAHKVPAAVDEEMPRAKMGPSIEELVATLEHVEQTYGAEHQITLAHRAHVDLARQDRDAAKPVHLQIRNAERKAEAKQRAESKTATALQLAKEALSKAEDCHREAEAAWKQAQEELTALRTKQLPKETDASNANNGASPPFSLSQEAMRMPGAAEKMAQLQEQFCKLQEDDAKWRTEQQAQIPESSTAELPSDLDAWVAGLEGESQRFAKAQRDSMGDAALMQLRSLLKGKGKGGRPMPYS